VELLRLGDGIKSHRARFEGGGKYECPEIKTFRVVDFKPAGSSPSFAAIQAHPTVHIAIVFSDDFSHATVFKGQDTTWSTENIKLGQSLDDILKSL
jgi:hypothetical protein